MGSEMCIRDSHRPEWRRISNSDRMSRHNQSLNERTSPSSPTHHGTDRRPVLLRSGVASGARRTESQRRDRLILQSMNLKVQASTSTQSVERSSSKSSTQPETPSLKCEYSRVTPFLHPPPPSQIPSSPKVTAHRSGHSSAPLDDPISRISDGRPSG